jgi:hypothetical protein
VVDDWSDISVATPSANIRTDNTFFNNKATDNKTDKQSITMPRIGGEPEPSRPPAAQAYPQRRKANIFSMLSILMLMVMTRNLFTRVSAVSYSVYHAMPA